MTITIKSLNEINISACSFLNAIKGKKIIAFYGKMAVGKTTFIKAICKELGVEDAVVSPTFSLINEYFAKNGKIIYHFDFYRINNIEEVYDFGYEEYFYGKNYCFIEWPEKVEELLPEECLKVLMTENREGIRELSFNIN